MVILTQHSFPKEKHQWFRGREGVLKPESNLTSASGSVQVTKGQTVVHQVTTILLLQKQEEHIKATKLTTM